jgi:FkbM family methyltransferase
MSYLLKKITRINNLKNKKLFNIKSKKISNLFKKISNQDKIQIYDIGAGLRYLPTLIKFDGISKIHLIDPNDNIEISYKNLKKIFCDKKSIHKYKVGLSNKNEKLFYYPAKVSSGSSFLNLKKKKDDSQYDPNYFGKEKRLLKKVYDFETFRKNNKLKSPDIVKVDVEGLEFKILSSILKKSKPLIIEVEVNYDNSIIGDTFLKTHSLTKKKNYKLNTIFPTYQNNNLPYLSERKMFLEGDYNNPLSRNSITQSDCYYILNKKKYNIRDLVMLIGYGFIIDAKKEYAKIRNELSTANKKIFEQLFNSLKNYEQHK